jgi:lysosomal acid lipase/cholesteryl ester hydrolase
MDVSVPQWFDERFPPLSIFYGGRDFLVLTEPLLARIKENERHIQLLRVERFDHFEVRIRVHYTE